MSLAIFPLTQETLKGAIALTKKVFNYPGFWWERPGFVLWLSLNQHYFAARFIFRLLGMRAAQYWVVATEEKEVLAVTGLYMLRDDPDAFWLGWTCVDPKSRGCRIGTQLLEFAISKTQRAGKPYLRLFTWDGDEAAVARHLYESRGFRLTRTEKLSSYSLLYYELPVPPADTPLPQEDGPNPEPA